MARVLTKKSTVAAKVPLATDLEIGELAVNTADAKLYTKHSDNTVKQLGIATTDSRLTDAREWTASTVTQAEAEAGTATTRRAWTAQRVFQAVASWWAASTMKTKLDGIATGATANATDAQLRDRSTHTGTQAISTVTGLQTALDGKISTTERGVSGGVATLDQFARIPPSQLPSYVDDVLDFLTTAEFPATGETGKIYIAINQGTAANPTRQYRWTGSVYAEINPSPGTTDALAEGSTNLYFNESRVRNTVLTGLSLASSAAVAATDTVLAAFGKLQARLNLLGTAANANVQTSAVDTTPGALMAVGAFGLGSRHVVTDADSAPMGLSIVNLSTAANVPAGMAGAGWLETDSELSFTGSKVQRLQTSDGSRSFLRTIGATAWREVFNTGNILGTVSQSGGVPTGAIIERGSNANGEYVRWADGTQICRNISSSLSYTTAANGSSFTGNVADSREFVFPAAFAATPEVVPLAQKVAKGVNGGAGQVWPHIGNGYPTQSAVSINPNSPISTNAAFLGYVAYGRWY